MDDLRNRGRRIPSVRRPGESLPPDCQPERKVKRSDLNNGASTSGSTNSCSSGNQQRTRSDRSVRIDTLHSRPETLKSKHGVTGHEVSLTANYFRLNKTPNFCFYQYHVKFDPNIELKRFRRGLLLENKSQFGGGPLLFDGATLQLTRELPDSATELSFQVKSRRDEEYVITIKYTGIVNTNTLPGIQSFNIILRSAMQGLSLRQVGRNFFDPHEKIDLRGQFKVQLWPGYVTSIRDYEHDTLLSAEIAYKTLRMETVLQMLNNCRGNDYQTAFKHKIIGVTVITHYNNMNYRVDDVDFSKNPQFEFDMKGRKISMIDYYYEKYNIRIRERGQPLLYVKTKDKEQHTFLVPELCHPCGIDKDMLNNFNFRKEMAEHTTRRAPSERIEKLRRFNNRLQSAEESQRVLRDWNIELDRSLITVRGRELPAETITFAEKRSNNLKKNEVNDKGSWELKDVAMLEVAQLKNWILIVPRSSEGSTYRFLQTLQRAAGGLKMNIPEPRRTINTQGDQRNYSYEKALQEACNYDPELIVCIVPDKDVSRYSTIKKFCCLQRVIVSQVVTKMAVENNKLSVATKIAVQLNAKLGGAPWMVSLPVDGTMVVGYDTCCNTTDKKKSYGAMVATMDQKVRRKYYSVVSEFETYNSFNNNFSSMLTMCLREYKAQHGVLPKRIMIYRDSVGDGSLEYLYEHEVKVVEKLLKEQYGDNVLKFTYIVVSKRLNTRLFKGNGNPRAGTVVDDIITFKERYDFYIISQHYGQGCASPTYYNVLSDSSGLSADRVQALTYKFCHVYYNWFGTTKVPAVCQYAQKLATLVATNLHHVPNLDNRNLYFL